MQNSESDIGVVITFQDGYLHITHPVNFVVQPQDIEGLWANLFKACQKFDCRKILNEGHLDLSRLRAFDSYNAGSQAGEIVGLRMACLFHGYTLDEKGEFFQMVASNRGSTIKFFTDKTEALKWLGVEAGDEK